MLVRMIHACVCVAALAAATGASAQVKLEGDPKVAFIYVSPANDGGWSTSHERGRQELEKATSYATAFTENVPEDNSQVRQAIDLYATRGFNIIIGSSFGFSDAFLEAAKAYPNVAFMNAAGVTDSANLESFYPRTYQGWYLAGMAAGAMTKTGKIGMVAGFPVSLVNWDINGFARGAQAVNPNVETIATFANTWYDPVKEGQAAEAMLEQGADVVATNLSTAVIIPAETKGAMSIGYQNDMSADAPKGHLTSMIFNWEKYLIPVTQKMAGGTWQSAGNTLVGIEYGIIDLSPFNAGVPQDLRDKIAAAKQAMIDGKLTPFDGPLYKQDGSLVIDKGAALTDDQLWAMDYFVKGITGTMPAQ